MKYKDWLQHKQLEYIDGKLFQGIHDVIELGKRYGTPLYITNQDIIEFRYSSLEKKLKERYDKVRIHYAVKANTNPSVLKVLNKLGAHVDCVSTGEITFALNAGFDPQKILYTGNNQTEEELHYALEKGVNINLDAISQVLKIKNMVGNTGNLPLISFRVNPEMGAGHHDHCITGGRNVKFGILDEQIIEAYKHAKDMGFTRFGIQTHIGSGILDIKPFKKAMKRYLEIVGNVARELNIKFEFIDFGGGIGIPYKPEQEPLDLDAYADVLTDLFKKCCDENDLGNPYFVIEPGRYIACESTILLVQVNTVKNTPYKNFVGVNAGFNTLVRPAMYGSYHHVIPCVDKPKAEIKTYDIVGQICESGDVFARDREIKKIEEKDYLVIMDAGAYGFSMASEYNTRPLPAELLLHGEQAALMRERQTLDDLMRHVNVPSWLK